MTFWPLVFRTSILRYNVYLVTPYVCFDESHLITPYACFAESHLITPYACFAESSLPTAVPWVFRAVVTMAARGCHGHHSSKKLRRRRKTTCIMFLLLLNRSYIPSVISVPWDLSRTYNRAESGYCRNNLCDSLQPDRS